MCCRLHEPFLKTTILPPIPTRESPELSAKDENCKTTYNFKYNDLKTEFVPCLALNDKLIDDLAKNFLNYGESRMGVFKVSFVMVNPVRDVHC